jgi:TatD DNase family protein
MYYDTHCHPYLAKEKTQEEVLNNFFVSGGKYMNTIWCDIKSSITSINIAQTDSRIFATIGIHPTHTLDYVNTLEETISQLEKLYHENSSNIVAIWEIWLDYHWIESLSQQYNISEDEIIIHQKLFFIAQIQLAKKLSLPIIIHNRSSASDVLQILIEQECKNFVFHCYSEDLEYAKKLLTFAPNCMLWFGWVLTFKSATWVQETVKNIPLRNIIIETDSPYLTPTPLRGKQENEPALVKHVLSKIIDLREEGSQTVSQQVFQNSKSFFGLI